MPFGFWKTSASSKQTASDGFNYTDGVSLGAQTNWANVDGTLIVENNGSGVHGFRGNTGGQTNIVRYTPGTWSANQQAQVNIVTINSGAIQSGGVAMRCDGSGNGYAVLYLAGTIYLVINNAGTENLFGTSWNQTLVAGNGLRASVTGAGSATRITITADLDNSGNYATTIVSSVDPGGTYISTGTPGVSAYTTSLGFLELFSNWAATDL